MIYLYLNENQVKALSLKKNLFGQYEVFHYDKTFQVSLIAGGQVGNVDILASAIKEVMTNLAPKVKDKEVTLILPQESFAFFKTEIPGDVAQSAVNDFIYDKATSALSINIHEYSFDFFVIENGNEKKINVCAISDSTLSRFKETFALLGLKIVGVIPDTVAYFKLFDKTLRKEKKENILYGYLDKSGFSGYLYDSYGLAETNQYAIKSSAIKEIESYLKKTTTQSEKANKKINRLILSGPESEKIRQDTFTKNTGAWTNPLKKIITNFYETYLKLLNPGQKPFPVLIYDSCFGAFIFATENKNFSLLRKKSKPAQIKTMKTTSFSTKKPLIKAEYLIFIASFIASFIFFVIISKLNLNIKLPEINLIPKPTAVPASPTPAPPSPTPKPSFKKEDLQIKILNGSGASGKAGEVKTILQKAGYSEILTGNADNYDYKNTVIEVKKTYADAFNILKAELKDYTTTIDQETLEASATADLIIIVGQDFK